MYNIEIFIFEKYTRLSKKAQIFYNYETYAEGVACKKRNEKQRQLNGAGDTKNRAQAA